ncbi:MAG TPA: hypothetical protein VKQ07_09010 [Jatrophihabitantaceae bacterium]|nr:hypothetical protein [Jatrophihabitantaceae bacterium]
MTMGSADVDTAVNEYEASCENLYRSELALHDAHQTHEDAWITAAADRLHQAVLRHESAARILEELRATA